MLEGDVFGVDEGGQLWDEITAGFHQFPEKTFRSMVHQKFKNNAQCESLKSFPVREIHSKYLITAFIVSIADLFKRNFGDILVEGCLNDCSLAWLYLDAKHLGLEEYRKIIQPGNVVCVGYGPVLDNSSLALNNHFENCPCKHDIIYCTSLQSTW